MATDKRILRPSEVCDEYGIGSTLLYEKLNPKSKYYDAAFPAPISLGGRSIGFWRNELDAWAEARPRLTPEARAQRATDLVTGQRRKRAGRKATEAATGATA